MATMADFPEFTKFMHRTNPDGVFVSFCRDCLVNVAMCEHEADLEAAEREHTCDPEMLEHFRPVQQTHG